MQIHIDDTTIKTKKRRTTPFAGFTKSKKLWCGKYKSPLINYVIHNWSNQFFIRTITHCATKCAANQDCDLTNASTIYNATFLIRIHSCGHHYCCAMNNILCCCSYQYNQCHCYYYIIVLDLFYHTVSHIERWLCHCCSISSIMLLLLSQLGVIIFIVPWYPYKYTM